MTEAVIVATARSPIGRAFKGSLTTVRPDDLTASMVTAALAKVPQLDPADVDDLILGCGLPGGEQGFNMARVVAVLLGFDHLPGTTVTRYCSSSLQTTRMAFHAIKAGEGDVFISAGVEMRQPVRQGQQRQLARHARTRCSPTPRPGRTRRRGAAAPRSGATRARTATLPDIYIAMGQTAENVAQLRGHHPGRSRTSSASRSRTSPRRRSPTGSGSATSPRSRCRTAPSWPPTTARGRASRWRRWPRSSRCSGPTARSPRATAARSTTAPRPW